jgi:hypothetical protein
MNRPAVPNTDHRTVWLANLIEAMETVGSSPAPCDRSVSKALRDRLHLPALLQPQRTLH